MLMLLTLLAVAALLICYLLCLIQAVAKDSWPWKAALYAIALVPSFAHGANYGLGLQTFLAAVLFLVLTRLMLVFGAREWGDRGSS
jgi:hypothetical protein